MRRLATASDAAALLAGGGVLLMPTDTIPGLHARADRAGAVGRIAGLKGRGPGRPFLMLCADAAQAAALAAGVDERASAYFLNCWPGPFTFVLKAAGVVPAAALGPGGTVALRVPEPAWLRELIAQAGGPLVSTSANPTGAPAPATLSEAEAWAGSGVDGVYAPAAGRDPGQTRTADPDAGAGRASALVDLTVRPARLLRPGPRPLPAAALAAEGETPGGTPT